MRSFFSSRAVMGLLVASPGRVAAAAMLHRLPVSSPATRSTLHLAARRTEGARALSSSSSDLEATIKTTISESKVVVFSKSWCPFCQQTKALFTELKVPFEAVELDKMAEGDALQMALLEFSGQRTVPNVFINGEHLGGNDDTQRAFRSGKLQEMLAP